MHTDFKTIKIQFSHTNVFFRNEKNKKKTTTTKNKAKQTNRANGEIEKRIFVGMESNFFSYFFALYVVVF